MLRWGILGTGNIARQFAGASDGARRGMLSAVGSRSIESARHFAHAWHVPKALGSYESLIASGDVDAVYISLPNSLHHEWTIRALRAGKHVLCEKPIAVDAKQAMEMFAVAREQNRVLAEAFMYRSHPLLHAVKMAVEQGKIGRPKLIRASFCFRVIKTDGNIRFDRSLAGGALMDIGCYCVNFARWIAGAEPTAIHGVAQLHPSGVDQLAAGLLQFPDDLTASFTCGMNAQADNTTSICGDEGYIEIPVPWKPPVTGATYRLGYSVPARMDQKAGAGGSGAGGPSAGGPGAGGPGAPGSGTGGAISGGPAGGHPSAPGPQTFSIDAGQPLYALEADDFARCVLDGQPPTITADDSIGNMRVLDELRRQVKVSFP